MIWMGDRLFVRGHPIAELERCFPLGVEQWVWHHINRYNLNRLSIGGVFLSKVDAMVDAELYFKAEWVESQLLSLWVIE